MRFGEYRKGTCISKSQVAITALEGFQINSKLVWDCHQFLVKLAEHKRIQLVWVTQHMGIGVNEIADQLARQGSSQSLVGTEPALGIFAEVARGVIRTWTSRKHEEYWRSIYGQRQTTYFIEICSAKRSGDILNLSRTSKARAANVTLPF